MTLTTILPLLLVVLSVTWTRASVTNEENCAHCDRMSSFPGWDQPLPTPWYSGYLHYELEGRQVHTHYVLIEAEDDESHTKPLIYWSNGGPGASSLFGLLTEVGPLILSDDSLRTEDYAKTGIPTPQYNPYTWSRLGNLLIIDQPAPVGFSYCQNDTESHSCGGLAWTDELASENAFLALRTFFDKHSHLSTLPLYLTGESYAGIYIPTLARRLEPLKQFQLKGFAVGDGCLGTETTMCGGLSHGEAATFRDYWHVLFLAGHHQIPLEDFQMVMRACSHADQPGFLSSNSRDDAICKAALAKVKKETGGFYEYALYDECTYRNGLLQHKRIQSFLNKHDEDSFLTHVQGALNDYPCGGGAVLEEFLHIDSVKEAFHVKSTFFEVDNAEGDFDYTPTEPDLTGFYKQVNGELRVLVYNGDTDPAITSFATANWTSHLGLQETQHWRPWTVDGCQQMGGYVTRYEGGFDFLTIRGAGHMVPTYKPAATFAFMQAWIQNDDYPTFDINCTKPDSPLGDTHHTEVITTSVLRG